MKDALIALREKRRHLWEEMKAVLDGAEKEGRDLNADEQTTYDRMEADMGGFDSRIQRLEKVAERDADLRTVDDKPVRPEPAKPEVRTPSGTIAMRMLRGEDLTDDEERREEAVMAQFRSFLRDGKVDGPEFRALQADLDPSGGYTLGPGTFVAQLIKDIDDDLVVQQISTVIPVTSGDSLGAPSLAADPADADWTSELLTGDEDSTMKFGARELKPSPLAKRIKVSRKLLRTSALPIDAIVRERLAYKHGIAREKAYMTGTGANQPLGAFTASDLGISTSRDVSTGNAETEIGADGLMEALYSLKSGYQNRASWIFHRDAVKQIRKLKYGDGQYIWSPGFGAQGASILDRPFYMSEYAPNTFTSGKYVGIVGDFSYYWIAELLAAEIQVLYELYAATAQVGYIGRLEVDAMPVLENAFARVTLA